MNGPGAPGEVDRGCRGKGTELDGGTARAVDGPVERRLLRVDDLAALDPAAAAWSSSASLGWRLVEGGIVADLRVGEGEGTSPDMPERIGDAEDVSTERSRAGDAVSPLILVGPTRFPCTKVSSWADAAL